MYHVKLSPVQLQLEQQHLAKQKTSNSVERKMVIDEFIIIVMEKENK